MNSMLKQMYHAKPESGIHEDGLAADKTQTPEPEKKKPKIYVNVGRRAKEKTLRDLHFPCVTLDNIGGKVRYMQDLCQLLMHFAHPEVYEHLHVSPVSGILLHGPPGCGKSLLAECIAGELRLPLLNVSCTEIVSGVSGDSEERLRELFDQAKSSEPCVLFLDNVDVISSKRESSVRDMERRIVSQLMSSMDDLTKASQKVLMVGATNCPDLLDPGLRRAGRFDRELPLGIPDVSCREGILTVLCKNLCMDSTVSLATLASLTPGYVGGDLAALVRESAMQAVTRSFHTALGTDDLLQILRSNQPLPNDMLERLVVNSDDFRKAIKVVQPSAKREGFATVPDVTWQDVGALHNVRKELQLCILAPVRYASQFDSLGLQTSIGVLLVGPPGCGKSLLAKAISNESGLNFISVKGPELLNMYVGESERAVRQVFLRAQNSAPCVIFFDELDALCPRRSSAAGEAGGGAAVRVVNQMLTEMDGVQPRRQVFILAATNRADMLDPALLRPGRLDKQLYVGLPSQEDRLDILKTVTRNGSRPPLARDVDLLKLAERTEHFSGADLTALVREAAMLALYDIIDENSSESKRLGEVPANVSSWNLCNSASGKVSGETAVLVTNACFEKALTRVHPSVMPGDSKTWRHFETP